MPDANDCKCQVLRVFVALYQAHPRAIDISSAQTHWPPPNQNDADYADKLASSGGTITWLYRNGYVNGEFCEAHPGSFMTTAQLSGRGYAIFRKLHPAGIEAVDKSDARELSVMADSLMDKLA